MLYKNAYRLLFDLSAHDTTYSWNSLYNTYMYMETSMQSSAIVVRAKNLVATNKTSSHIGAQNIMAWWVEL